MGFVKRVQPAEARAELQATLAMDPLSRSLPAVMEYLTQDRFDDGAPRQTSTLTLSYDDGRLRAALNDRANGRTLWLSSDSLETLLSSLEAVLQSGAGEWRKNVAWKKGR